MYHLIYSLATFTGNDRINITDIALHRLVRNVATENDPKLTSIRALQVHIMDPRNGRVVQKTGDKLWNVLLDQIKSDG